MTRTEKLAEISEGLSDGYIFVKLRLLIEEYEEVPFTLEKQIVLDKVDNLLDTFLKLINSVK